MNDYQQIKDHYLALISARTSDRSREVYKYKNTKIGKYISRSRSEDNNGPQEATPPTHWPDAIASDQCLPDVNLGGLRGSQESQIESGNVIAPATTSSREFSGITVQHAKTDKGIKLFVTTQRTNRDSDDDIQKYTAELKRYDRLREIKATADDSEEFELLLDSVKSTLHKEKKKQACVGRLHIRGQRSAWFSDALVTGILQDGKIVSVVLFIGNDSYDIDLTKELTPAQAQYYHNLGIYGHLTANKRAPRMIDAPVTKMKA
jgi:hypothetical protein